MNLNIWSLVSRSEAHVLFEWMICQFNQVLWVFAVHHNSQSTRPRSDEFESYFYCDFCLCNSQSDHTLGSWNSSYIENQVCWPAAGESQRLKQDETIPWMIFFQIVIVIAAWTLFLSISSSQVLSVPCKHRLGSSCLFLSVPGGSEVFRH
jgi:hypothetical protein